MERERVIINSIITVIHLDLVRVALEALQVLMVREVFQVHEVHEVHEVLVQE